MTTGKMGLHVQKSVNTGQMDGQTDNGQSDPISFSAKQRKHKNDLKGYN